MDAQDILSIVSIVISSILSITAMILSIWFYRESTSQNKETALMQSEIKNSVNKLEQLSNRTYTDTFGALKTQLDVMQKHIFSDSVGITATSAPNNLRFSILGCMMEKTEVELEDLCKDLSGYETTEITQMVYSIHRDGLVEFDGKRLKYLIGSRGSSEGQGEVQTA